MLSAADTEIIAQILDQALQIPEQQARFQDATTPERLVQVVHELSQEAGYTFTPAEIALALRTAADPASEPSGPPDRAAMTLRELIAESAADKTWILWTEEPRPGQVNALVLAVANPPPLLAWLFKFLVRG